MTRAPLTLLPLLVLLAGCGRADQPSADALDAELTGPLAEQIRVDPKRLSGRQSTPPAATPAASEQTAEPVADAMPCRPAVAIAPEWADRLPTAFALPAGARVTEAGGGTDPSCTLAVVSFAAPLPPERLVAHFAAAARRAGFDAGETRDGPARVAAGSRGEDAWHLSVNATADGGSLADLVVATAK